LSELPESEDFELDDELLLDEEPPLEEPLEPPEEEP